MTTLVHAHDGTLVSATIRGVVMQPPHESNGKTYATIAVSPPHATVRDVDDEIRRRVPGILYSPLLDRDTDDGRDVLVVKIDRKALVDRDVARGTAVDVHVSLGAYASFGYCWIATIFVTR